MKTIILVENDPVVIKVYGSEFELEGFGVEVAPDGLVALKMLTAVRPDVVVVDLTIPKSNGTDVIKYIRSTPALKTIPVVILTKAYMTMTSLVQQAAAIGADMALLKSSCTPGQLLEVINELLSRASRLNPTLRSGLPCRPRQPSRRLDRHNHGFCFSTLDRRFTLHNVCRAARTTLTMKTIFLVEDDLVVIKVYAAKFLREGFSIEVAKDGLEAMKMLAAVRPDVVVLDLMMPKFNGVDVLRFIRSNPALKDVPVIILSNAHMTSLAQEAAAIGAERSLLKSSCTPGLLIEVINDLLSGKGG